LIYKNVFCRYGPLWGGYSYSLALQHDVSVGAIEVWWQLLIYIGSVLPHNFVANFWAVLICHLQYYLYGIS